MNENNVMETITEEVKNVEAVEIAPLTIGEKVLIGGGIVGLMALGALIFEKGVKPAYKAVKTLASRKGVESAEDETCNEDVKYEDVDEEEDDE